MKPFLAIALLVSLFTSVDAHASGRRVQCFYKNENGDVFRAFGRGTPKVSRRAWLACRRAGSESCQLLGCRPW